jgi:hypothetical protein
VDKEDIYIWLLVAVVTVVVVPTAVTPAAAACTGSCSLLYEFCSCLGALHLAKWANGYDFGFCPGLSLSGFSDFCFCYATFASATPASDLRLLLLIGDFCFCHFCFCFCFLLCDFCFCLGLCGSCPGVCCCYCSARLLLCAATLRDYFCHGFWLLPMPLLLACRLRDCCCCCCSGFCKGCNLVCPLCTAQFVQCLAMLGLGQKRCKKHDIGQTGMEGKKGIGWWDMGHGADGWGGWGQGVGARGPHATHRDGLRYSEGHAKHRYGFGYSEV